MNDELNLGEMDPHTLIVEEEEQLILVDRATKGSCPLIGVFSGPRLTGGVEDPLFAFNARPFQ